MKRIVSFTLVLCIVFGLFASVYAGPLYWDLAEKPDFTGYRLGFYLFAPDERFLEYDEIPNELTEKVLKVFEDVEFSPIEKTNFNRGEYVISMIFQKPTWETDRSAINSVDFMDDGIYFKVWDRTEWVEHCAFVECDTKGMIEKIKAIVEESLKVAEAEREQIEQKQEEERSKYEKEINSFKKVYTLNMSNVTMNDSFGSKVEMNLEFGICSYKVVADNTIAYACYLEMDNGTQKVREYYYTSDYIEKNNIITFSNIAIYNDTENNKYYLYTSEDNQNKITVQLNVDENKVLKAVELYIVHSGFSATVEKDAFEESGTLRDYGNLIITYSKEPDSTEIKNEEEKDDANVEEKEPEKSEDTPKIVEEEKNVIEENEEQKDQKTENIEEKTEEEKTEVPEEKPIEKSYADKLSELGLFKGTENGYELESTFTRAQGATMLVRLLGKEQEALEIELIGIFDDVPADDWVAPYVEYCYNNGITKGTGENTYSPEDVMNGAQYITLVLRALGYTETEPETASETAKEVNLLSEKEALNMTKITELTREEMVYISYSALGVKMPSGKTLIEKLVEEKAVKEESAE